MCAGALPRHAMSHPLHRLPTILTLARLIAGPIVAGMVLWAHGLVYVERERAGLIFLAAACVFALAALTDWLDGFLARALKATSVMGAALDHAADKALTISALVALAYASLSAPLVVATIIVIGRDVAVAGLREGLAESGRRLPVSWAGKIKAAVELAAITALLATQAASLLGAPERIFTALAWGSAAGLWLAALLALWSGLGYAVRLLRGAH